MKINLSPIRADYAITASVSGDVITVNGVSYDFSSLNDGDILPASAVTGSPFAGEIKRVGAEIELTLILPHEADASEARRFPTPVAVTNGPVPLPE